MTHKAMVTDVIRRTLSEFHIEDGTNAMFEQVVIALTAALAQAETQPVAWRFKLNKHAPWGYTTYDRDDVYASEPLFASPVPAKREAGVVDEAKRLEAATSAILNSVPEGYGMRRTEARVYAQAAITAALSTSSTPADGEDRAAPVPHVEAVSHGWRESHITYHRYPYSVEWISDAWHLRFHHGNGAQHTVSKHPDPFEAMAAAPSPPPRALPTTLPRRVRPMSDLVERLTRRAEELAALADSSVPTETITLAWRIEAKAVLGKAAHDNKDAADRISTLEAELQKAREAALEEAAKIAEAFRDNHWMAHDIKVGLFPKRSEAGVAIADSIRALGQDKEG